MSLTPASIVLPPMPKAQVSGGRRSLREFGAVGNGETDDTEAVLRAFGASRLLTGEGLTYKVYGNIDMPRGLDLEDARFKQGNFIAADVGTLRMQLRQGTGPPLPDPYPVPARDLTLRRVSVNRNGRPEQPTQQVMVQLDHFNGIAIAGARNVVLEDVEVTGDGRGTGLHIFQCERLHLVRPYVHDIQWATRDDPKTEQVVGIWMVDCVSWVISEPFVQHLGGAINNVHGWIETDGISVSGCRLWQIIGGHVDNCGEGIDVSGNAGNQHFAIIGVMATDCETHGIKFANSAHNGTVTGCIARACGLHGFVVSGPTQAENPDCEDITFVGCTAIDTGANGAGYGGRWLADQIAGFAIRRGPLNLPTLPRGIIFQDCLAIADPSTMKYGFFSAVPQPKRSSYVLNCRVRGASVKEHNGVTRSGGTIIIGGPEAFGWYTQWPQ